MCLNTDVRPDKLDLEFLLQPVAVQLCHSDHKVLTSSGPHSPAPEGDLLCHTCGDLGIIRRELCGIPETPDQAPTGPPSSFSTLLAGHVWASHLTSLNT